MKKLILTSAAILFIGISAFAGDEHKCSKKCDKKCEVKECTTKEDCSKKCSGRCTADGKSNTENSKSCQKKCKADASKNNNGMVK